MSNVLRALHRPPSLSMTNLRVLHRRPPSLSVTNLRAPHRRPRALSTTNLLPALPGRPAGRATFCP